jgi:hypothetical protein
VIGGAWPFLVGGVICLPNRDNERDPYLLNSRPGLGRDLLGYDFLEGLEAPSLRKLGAITGL